MTISSTTRKAGPYTGNGTTSAFPFAFKVFTAADLYVVKTNSSLGVDSVLALTSDYTVSLNSDQNANPGGTVTLAAGVLPTGYALTLTSSLAYLQPTDLTNQGGFYPSVITNALDRLTIFCQQLYDAVSRSLKVSVSTPAGVSTTLPVPSANKLLGWNPSADALQNVDAGTLATLVAYGTANADKFSGNGSTTQFALSANPGALNNLDISVGGVTQRPGIDYTWSTGTNLTFTTAPPSGSNNILVRYMQGLPQGYTAADLVSYLLAGSGAITRNVQSKLREVVSLEDFGAVGDGVTSDALAASAACAYCFLTGATLRLQGKVYKGARVEVHGSFTVEGNGATVDYLGIGTTLILGTGSGTSAVPSAWPNDPSYDPSGLFNPVMYALASPVAIGAQSLTLVNASGLSAGGYLFLAGSPTSASSAGNYIPRDFEFVKVLSVVGNVVTATGRIKNAYTTSAAAFYSAGLAVNCRVSDLRLSTSVDAYQFVVRSSYGCELENIEFAGQSAAGASTFSELLRCKNFKIVGTHGPLSTARGTVSAMIDGVEWCPRTGSVGEDCAIFIEESFYKIDIRNVRSYGGYFSIRQLDLSGAAARRVLTLSNSVFDTSNASNGATGALQNGSCPGCDQYYSGVVFTGAVVTPASGQFPGITGTALTWQASNQTADIIKFSACHFSSAGTGDAFKFGSGFLGSVLFDDLCTFSVVSLAANYYRGSGWQTFPVASPATNSDANTAYYKRDTTVTLRGGVVLNSLSTGGTLGTLPVGYRPLVGDYYPVTCVGTGGAYFTVGAIAISTSGVISWQGSERTAVVVLLGGVSFPVV